MNAYLMPHAPVFLPTIGITEAPKVASTCKAMQKIAEKIADYAPETIVVISPHGARFTDALALYDQDVYQGDLKAFGDFENTFTYEKDIALIEAIVKQGQEMRIPFYPLKSEEYGRFDIDDKLDHGVTVPLYFIDQAYKHRNLEPYKLVCLSDGDFSQDVLINAGHAIRIAAKAIHRKIVLIASGDLSHTLSDQGAYNYQPEGAVVDQKICDAIKAQSLDELTSITLDIREKAGVCGYNAIMMLLGIYNTKTYTSELLSYEGPFGVGYGVAQFSEGTSEHSNRAHHALEVLNHEVKAIKRQMSIVAEFAYHVLMARLSTSWQPKIQMYDYGYTIDEQRFEISESGVELLKTAVNDVFVTIKYYGALRGCIGSVGDEKSAPLFQKVAYFVNRAAFHDDRFEPIMSDEIKGLTLSVDVLSPLESIKGMDDLEPNQYGVVVSDGERQGVLLPALSGVENVVEQVRIAAQKGGFSVDNILEMYRFTVERYH